MAVKKLNEPFTLLLLGSDSRCGGDAARSDTILVLHANPAQKQIRGLSLPRDLYVPIRGLPIFRTERVNAALFYGDYYSRGGGIDAASDTIGALLDVPVKGAVVVRFDLVENVVDALGGVNVYCDAPAFDKQFNPLMGGKPYPVRFESGWNHLNGKRALEFVRLRKPDTDFGRMKRNRAFLSAVIARVRSFGGLMRVPRILPRLPENVETDMGLLAWVRTAWAFARCSGDVAWDTIDRNETLPFITPRGAQVLMAEPGVLEQAGRTLMGREPLHLVSAGGASDSGMVLK